MLWIILILCQSNCAANHISNNAQIPSLYVVCDRSGGLASSAFSTIAIHQQSTCSQPFILTSNQHTNQRTPKFIYKSPNKKGKRMAAAERTPNNPATKNRTYYPHFKFNICIRFPRLLNIHMNIWFLLLGRMSSADKLYLTSQPAKRNTQYCCCCYCYFVVMLVEERMQCNGVHTCSQPN